MFTQIGVLFSFSIENSIYFFYLVFDHVNMLISSAFHIGRFNLKPFLCFYFLMYFSMFFKNKFTNNSINNLSINTMNENAIMALMMDITIKGLTFLINASPLKISITGDNLIDDEFVIISNHVSNTDPQLIMYWASLFDKSKNIRFVYKKILNENT